MTAGKCYLIPGEISEIEAAYNCDVCGSPFRVRHGDTIECPTCAAIENAPDLRGCPHCGGYSKIEIEWTQPRGTQKFRVICQICGCQTRACNYADDAAASWNDRVEGSS